MAVCVWLEAVTVALPAVLSVTLKLLLPLTRAALAGNTALGSLELIATVSLVLIRFQLASTALTVTLNAVPALCAVGVPVLPVAVPAEADSPGARIWSLTKAPGLTVIEGLVLGFLVLSEMSLAVIVAFPAVLSVALKVLLPLSRAALVGKLALASEELRPTVSVTLVRMFQLASTALTVTLKELPAVCAVGVPVLPLAVPGAAVSPGSKSCNFVNAPPFTLIEGLVLLVTVVCVTLEAVRVALPAVLRVTLKFLLPPIRAVLGGRAALASLEVIETVSFVLTTFQNASTALTVTLKAEPACSETGAPVFPIADPGAVNSPGTSN